MPAVTNTEAPRPRRLSKQARRAQLLDTAGELLLRDGVDALTMEGIGQGAGASKTLGYAYFDNVDHVIVALRERELGLMFLRQGRPKGGSTVDANAGGVQLVRAKLDNGFFRARWDRATRTEREFMAAMSVDGDTPSEIGIVAKRLRKAINSLGLAQANLIAKGLVWAPEHGQIAFTVPGMSAFIERETART